MIQADASSTQMSTANIVTTSASGFGSKYDGLIAQSFTKVLRNMMYSYLSYMDSIVPMFLNMHLVISIWRLFQFWGSSICAGSLDYWEEGLPRNAVSIFSIFFHLVPSKERQNCASTVNIIFICLFAVFFFVWFSSAYYLHKYAKLPNSLVIAINILLSTAIILFPPVMVNLAGEALSYMIMGVNQEFSLAGVIVVFIFTVIIVVAILICFKVLICVSLIFRPMSLQTVLAPVQDLINELIYLSTFLLAISSHLSMIPKIVFMVLGLASYGVSIKVVFDPGTIIDLNYRKAYLAVCISSMANLLILIIYTVIGRQATVIELFVFVGIFIIAFVVAHFIIQQNVSSILTQLDSMEENPELVADIKTTRKMCIYLCTGMQYAHPFVANWQLFNLATEAFPSCSNIWIIFAKFVAIYPEESNLLGYIIRNMIQQNLKGFRVKQIIVQAGSVQNQREQSLTVILKKKLTHLSKSVTAAKTKQRHIWDLIIQGNISEMENAVKAGYNQVEKCRNDFLHAIRQYPNNRFIIRSYTRFLFEVLSDQDSFNEWKEKINAMKNGHMIAQDLTHVLGMNAFPILPDSVVIKPSLTNYQQGAESELMSFDSEFIEEPENNVSYEQTKLITTKIENITIPSLQGTIIWTLVLFLIFVLGMTIGLSVYSIYFINDTDVPLDFMYYISLIRCYSVMIPLWLHHYILEKIVFGGTPIFNPPNYTGVPLEAFGGFNDTRSQLNYILTECSKAMEALSTFHTFKPNDPILAHARTLLYEPVVPHRVYTDHSTYTTSNESLQAIIMNNLVLISEFLLDDESNTASNFYTSAFRQTYTLTPYMTCQDLIEYIADVLEYIEQYLLKFANDTSDKILIIEICVCVGIFIIYFISAIVVIIRIGRDKTTIYKCLTALPKNVVSSVSESLRVLNKNSESSRFAEDDTEVSKQEDSMLKMFANAGDSSTVISIDNTVFAIMFLLFGALAIAIAILALEMLPNSSEALHTNSPHIINLLGTSTYMLSALVSYNDGVAGNNNYSPLPSSKNMALGTRTVADVFEIVHSSITLFYNDYHDVKFGTRDLQTSPYEQFENNINALSTEDLCPNRSALTTTVREAIDCMPFEFQILTFSILLRKYTVPYLDTAIGDMFETETFGTRSELTEAAWYLVCKIYAHVCYPMFNQIVDNMKELMLTQNSSTRTILILLAIVALIVEIGIILYCFSVRTKLVFALKLLLHCNPVVVTSTPKVMDVLGGNFASTAKDMTQRDKLYYDSVLMDMPNATVIADQNFKVTSVNRAFERMFPNIQTDSFISSDIRTFFKDPKFKANEFQVANNKEEELVYQNNDTSIHLHTSAAQISQNWVVTFIDISQVVSYNTLIKEERSKSDKLLASILPPDLVGRVQAGEKNISFAVQSSSILFMDIVEFTPWCASGTAQYVMSTLNLLYKYFDADLSIFKTLTKIKCIGDCYMAAGGIFTELNQPAVHSREMVEFGLAAIESVNELNKEKNESLRIRVGINTGGPIVAGVLGTEKPTFEILGPAINMAQQMEHNGVPMQVHISRSVYELVYGGPFIIKERGQIQIKNGKAVTYLVESRTD